MRKPIIVGVSASLRNARSRRGASEFVRDLSELDNKEELIRYLTDQGKCESKESAAHENQEFSSQKEGFKHLKNTSREKGLSNSEIGLGAALWGAHSEGAEIMHVPLSDYFFPDGRREKIQELRNFLMKADGVIISTPVYFGDRSSLSQNLIEMIRQDGELKVCLKGKVYGGVAVGAKRNGGQETTLIYQMHDMMELGLLGVGNDFETTSQYGGTGHAGELGSMSKDDYGIGTCIGTGRRVTRVSKYFISSSTAILKDKIKLGLWILQDKNDDAQKFLNPFLKSIEDRVDIKSIKMFKNKILPCIACDLCPSRIAADDQYCCIRGKSDDMIKLHNEFLDVDVIMPVILSPKNRGGLKSVYQQFLERTRYLRRGDYLLADRLISPIILAEIGTNENMNLRVTTSLIRHQTVLLKPILGWIYHGKMLNPEDIVKGIEDVISNGIKLTIGRLSRVSDGYSLSVYKPVGYVLAVAQDKLPETIEKRDQAIEFRLSKFQTESKRRLVFLKQEEESNEVFN